MKNCSLRWLSKKDSEDLSALAVPLARQTYPYMDREVLERFIKRELSPEGIEKGIDDRISYAFIEQKGTVAGFLAYSTQQETLHLEKLYLKDEFKGQGIGSEVMEWVFNKAKSEGYRTVETVVVDLNIPAIKFYKKFGFKRTTAEKGYTVKRSIMVRTFRSAELFSSYYI